MSGRIRYTEEFKKDAAYQVTDRGHSVADVSRRLGVSTKSMYDWVKLYSQPDRHLECTCQGFTYRGNCQHVREVREKIFED